MIKGDRVEIYKSRRTGQYGWRYKAKGNNKKLANAGETYLKIAHALKMVRRLFGDEISVEYVGVKAPAK